jgi:cytosine/adenosine deaminase-related metal-dependent hydrolase
MRYRIETAAVAVNVRDSHIDAPGPQRRGPTFSVPGGELRPGLINAHDHLHRNHFPRLGRPPYTDAYEWGRDIHVHDGAAIDAARALPLRTALLFGAFRNLIGGVTCVAHHDRREPDLDADFPLRVPRIRTAHSPGFDRAGMSALAAALRRDPAPFTIHVAEGVTTAAAAELHALGELGLLRPELLAVHCIAVTDADAARLRRAGSAIVWCPTSNIHLFGRTCAPAVLDACDVLLGTDALLTADGTMLDELHAARRLGLLPVDRIEAAVGALAAARLGLPAMTLDPGAPADLLLLRTPLANAGVADVALVIVGGRPRIADEELRELFDAAGEPAVHMVIGGVTKLVARDLAEAADTVLARWPEAARILAPAAVAVARP